MFANLEKAPPPVQGRRAAAAAVTEARTRMRILVALALALCAVLSSLYQTRAGADDSASSGAVHGSVGVRGNYYWERSTRVVAPSVNASLITPVGVRVEGTYLLDAITSASQATGVQSDVGFTEIRNDVQGGVGYELDLGNTQIDMSASGRFSKEPDYLSRGIGFSGGLSLFERTSTLRLNGYYLHDLVSKIDRMAPAENPGQLMAADPVRVGNLDALSLGLALDQVLTPTLIATAGVDAGFIEGFQANVYRTATFADGGARPEEHPERRVRQAYYLWLAQYLTVTRSALRLGYRYYQDTWKIHAHAPEVRLHQEVGRYAELRLRYRYYTQDSAFFWRKGGNLRKDRYATADPKMSVFHNQTIGMKLRVELSFLGFTALSFAETAVIDFGIEYVFNTNRFGNGVIGQGGLTWPF